MKNKMLLVAAIGFACVTSTAQAQDRAGFAAKLQPASTQLSGAFDETLAEGDTTYRNATIQTERFGSAELSLDDGSKLTVAPNSEVVIDRFLFDPDSGSGSAAISLGAGALRMISGRVPPGNVEIRTGVATIGIRGTDFILPKSVPGELEIFVDEGTVTATPEQGYRTFELTAPAYAVCTGSSCEARGGGIKPITFPPAPQGWQPSGESSRSGADGEDRHGGGTT